MQVRYLANAGFLITLASGATLLTDPWLEGPCQQTWHNFPPVPEVLRAEIYGATPDAIYISHLHHDHLHPQTLAHFDRATPVLIGAMNTPNLRNALRKLGFLNLIEVAFETRTPVPALGCEVVLFKDFHGNTRGDDTQVEYDLDTSIYLYDHDGTRLFNAVDNTILPPDAARIRAAYGAPDLAILPYASASLYPMAMADFSPEQKRTACATIRARTGANFRDVFASLGARHVIPAGGEYVLGGPVAALSEFLPQPLASELSPLVGEALRKLYPGDAVDAATGDLTPDPRATHRGFGDPERLAHALTLAGETPSYAQVALPDDLAFDWPRALSRCAANLRRRMAGMGIAPALDVYLDVVSWPGREPGFLFRMALDGETAWMVSAPDSGERARLVYTLDEKLLFALVTGLVSWNAIEASALMAISRRPDVYQHDVHRSIVHFTLLA